MLIEVPNQNGVQVWINTDAVRAIRPHVRLPKNACVAVFSKEDSMVIKLPASELARLINDETALRST